MDEREFISDQVDNLADMERGLELLRKQLIQDGQADRAGTLVVAIQQVKDLKAILLRF